LLAICLRKIKGLNRVKLISAGFIWTEPHSKRIKVKLTVSKEVSNLTLIEQSFIVEFIEAYTQCDDCKK
jgi:nonsense-mediated mRNA decay protein 3